MRLPAALLALVLAGTGAIHAVAANSPPPPPAVATPVTPLPGPSAGPPSGGASSTLSPSQFQALSTSGMAAHKALYTLTLSKAKGGDVIAARGTMGYEVTDACDGWAVRQRLKMTITNADGQDIVMTSDYATWEAKNGLKFRFHVRQTTDEAITSQTDGDAVLTKIGGAGEAHYTSPHPLTVALPQGTLFPMMHTAAILAAAKEKRHFLGLPLFDGTDDNGVEDSFIVILGWSGPTPTKWPVLSALPSTRVHLSFFDNDRAAITPSYEVSMRYWENGVADGMKMDFGDFIMEAKMTEFSTQPHRC